MFKQCCSIAAFALAAGVPLSAPAQPGVSVNIGQPGFYGRIDIGPALPPPALIYPEPVIVAPPPRVVQRAPIYLRVPPGHAKHWRKHCARYQACGQPVYFVQDRWYDEVYAPRHRMAPPRGFEPGYGPPHRRDRYDEQRRRQERDDDHDHGRGRGHGRGH